MDPMHSEVVPFSEEDVFPHMEYFDSRNVRVPDLRYPIHPLFQTIAGTNGHYRYPSMACRLASLLLEKALPFFHSILVVGDSVEDCNNGTFEHDVCPAPKASLTIHEQQETHAKLRELATGVRMSLDLNEEASRMVAHALCTSDRTVTFTQLPGRGSKILVNVNTLNAVSTAESGGDIVTILWSTIELATSLVHEMAHAAVYSTHKCLCPGVFIGTSQTSETGFDLETFLFGGVLQPVGEADEPRCYFIDEEPSAFPGMICCEEYPNFMRMDNLPPGIPAMVGGPPLPDTYIFWSTPFPWVHNLLQQSFWDDALTSDNNALHPPRTSGVIVAQSADPVVKAQQQRTRATQLMASGEYEVNDRGIISLSQAATEPEYNVSGSIVTSSEGEEEEQQE